MDAGVSVPEKISCVECGGTCHRLSYPPPDEGWAVGDVVAYRCADCAERFDVVVPDPAEERGDGLPDLPL